MEETWNWFARLRKTCPPTEIVSPITYVEIEAFGRTMGLHIRPWQVEAIRDVDDVAREIWVKKAHSKERLVVNEVDANDSAAVGAFLRSKAAQQKEG